MHQRNASKQRLSISLGFSDVNLKKTLPDL